MNRPQMAVVVVAVAERRSAQLSTSPGPEYYRAGAARLYASLSYQVTTDLPSRKVDLHDSQGRRGCGVLVIEDPHPPRVV